MAEVDVEVLKGFRVPRGTRAFLRQLATQPNVHFATACVNFEKTPGVGDSVLVEQDGPFVFVYQHSADVGMQLARSMGYRGGNFYIWDADPISQISDEPQDEAQELQRDLNTLMEVMRVVRAHEACAGATTLEERMSVRTVKPPPPHFPEWCERYLRLRRCGGTHVILPNAEKGTVRAAWVSSA
jgi:hypothetical protein